AEEGEEVDHFHNSAKSFSRPGNIGPGILDIVIEAARVTDFQETRGDQLGSVGARARARRVRYRLAHPGPYGGYRRGGPGRVSRSLSLAANSGRQVLGRAAAPVGGLPGPGPAAAAAVVCP